MKECNIIFKAIIQTDGKQKKRPALILKELPESSDLLSCGISTPTLLQVG